MKKITFFIIVFTLSISVNAQIDIKDYQSSKKKHELSVNALGIAFNKYQISYDYLLNEQSSLGLSLSYTPENALFNKYKYNEKFQATLNYKLFFSKNNTKGFYVKGSLEYEGSNNYLYDYANHSFLYNKPNPYQNVYLGLSIGYKYVTKKNLFFDVNAGFSERIYGNRLYTRCFSSKPILSFSIGKRF